MNAVLVVDDDDDWRMLLSMCFEDAGFAVRSGRNVQEGIAALTAGGIDVLVSDYVLPDGNGLDLLAGGAQPRFDTRRCSPAWEPSHRPM